MPIAPSSLSFNYGSTNIFAEVIDTAYNADDTSKPVVGSSFTSNVPISAIPSSLSGVRAMSFGDIYYNAIWIIPRNVALGNLVNVRTEQVEVWNAFFADHDLTGISVVGDDTDLTLTGFASGTFPALGSHVYNLTATLGGPPTIDVAYVFEFTGIDSDLTHLGVTGSRVVAFPLRHNWIDNVLEQISFKTDILVALSGKEQRIKLRSEPRRRIEMSYLTMTAQDRAFVENVLFGWHGRTFAVPLWNDQTPLTGDVAAGATAFSLDTVGRDFDVDGYIFITDGTNYDILRITAVTDTGVVTESGVINAYSAGVRAAPARIAVLESKLSISQITNEAESMRLAWQLLADQQSVHRKTSLTLDTYRGLDVYSVANDYKDALSISQDKSEDILDAETGLFAKYSINSQPRRTVPFRQLLLRNEIGQFFTWLYEREGQLNPFWFVDRTKSFKLAGDITLGSTTITVDYNGYTNLVFGNAARKDIAISGPSGWIYRRISNAVDNGDGTETLTLDSAVGANILATSDPLISYLKCVRLATDTAEVSYQTTNAISTSLSYVDLLTTP